MSVCTHIQSPRIVHQISSDKAGWVSRKKPTLHNHIQKKNLNPIHIASKMGSHSRSYRPSFVSSSSFHLISSRSSNTPGPFASVLGSHTQAHTNNLRGVTAQEPISLVELLRLCHCKFVINIHIHAKIDSAVITYPASVMAQVRW